MNKDRDVDYESFMKNKEKKRSSRERKKNGQNFDRMKQKTVNKPKKSKHIIYDPEMDYEDYDEYDF